MFTIIFLLNLISCGVSNSSDINNSNNSERKKIPRENKKQRTFKNSFDKADHAILNNNLIELREAIEEDPSIISAKYTPINDERTLLMQALYSQDKNRSIDIGDIIELLFKGSDLTAKDHYGMSVLHYAVFNVKYVEEVLKNKNVDVNALSSTSDETALMKSVFYGYSDSVKILLGNNNLNVSLENFEGENILHCLAKGIVYRYGRLQIALDDADEEMKKKSIKEYMNLFKILASSSKIDMKKLMNEQNFSGETALKLFTRLIDLKIDEDKKIIEANDIFNEGAKRIFSREHEIVYWKEIKKIFLPLFEKNL